MGLGGHPFRKRRERRKRERAEKRERERATWRGILTGNAAADDSPTDNAAALRSIGGDRLVCAVRDLGAGDVDAGLRDLARAFRGGGAPRPPLIWPNAARPAINAETGGGRAPLIWPDASAK